MCAHYRPVVDIPRLLAHFGVIAPPHDAWPDEVRSMLQSPVLRRPNDEASANKIELFSGQFGLMPYWAKDPTLARRTFNARSETAATKENYRDAWRKGQRCIVPVECLYASRHDDGKATRWQVERADGMPMGIAGLWSLGWSHNGAPVPSFTILTIAADDHEVFQGFQRPEDDKRMPVILNEADYETWLDCPVEAMSGMMTRYPSALLIAKTAM